MPNSIEKSIDLKAPVERVWRALTDHREFGEWFRVAIATPFEEGRPARGYILHPGYEHVMMSVLIKEMQEPTLFSFTWHPYAIDPHVDYSTEIPTLVEFRLQPIPSGTKLTVTETGFDAIPAHRMPEAFRMNEGGWAIQVENIKKHVES
ncbi:SRPBCC family protein [Rhizobium sp. KVB221]|uniref:SRPBCC family protein n=1 Tax=Rhizobium setariae TaxID=2801340 RepID=A0A937CQL3_9HYPH|nr:SRPBCC family protein [Rhizobium setariae]MBL0373162.1 SRPBCC family protein [Rhizobium setariae]